jgi:formate dehydrogenase maturation protein FdhE
MSVLPTATANYRSRIKRAELLGKRYSSAAEVLAFYVKILRFQKEVSEEFEASKPARSVGHPGSNLRGEFEVSGLLRPFGRFLSLVETEGPSPLRTRAAGLGRQPQSARAAVLREFWKTGLLETDSLEPLTEFLARAFLLPCAEFLAGALAPPSSPTTVRRCPRCHSLPLLGVLRPAGEGGKRFLQCSFCSEEWEFRRILCAHCGEEQEQKLPVYIAEQFAHVRVECCETCKRFLRTIDLTKDGNAVPMVDDLAAIPLSLWALENGYARIQGNLLGT